MNRSDKPLPKKNYEENPMYAGIWILSAEKRISDVVEARRD